MSIWISMHCRHPASLGTGFGTVIFFLYWGWGGGVGYLGVLNLIYFNFNFSFKISRSRLWTVRYPLDKQIFFSKFFNGFMFFRYPICRTRGLESGNWPKTLLHLMIPNATTHTHTHTHTHNFLVLCCIVVVNIPTTKIVPELSICPPPLLQTLNQLFDLANCSRTDDAWQFKFYCI